MPPKKKKPPFKDDQELVDVFSYVELVQDCLDRAESSQKACLEGILKADLALRQSQSDADIHFIVLVRRAELLLIAVKKKYETSDLSTAHRNPLKSCISDCEQVIAKVSAADPISRGIYEQACTILRDAKEIQKSQSSRHVEGKGGTFQRYDPTKTLFRNITKINPYLLQDVVNCYEQFKMVCRTCFYKHNLQEPIGANRHCRRCKRTTHPLVVIPASKMCNNLTGSKVLAIPSPPRTLMAIENKHKPFQMCKKNEHKLCNDKSASGDTWFAHSIEELVIWTVERHYDVKFNRYIEVYHRDHDPPDHSLFDGQSSEPQGSSQPISSTGGGQSGGGRPYQYYASECTFPTVASIPERLFWDVLNCYKNFKEYCKWCYYVKDERGVVVINRRSNSTMCSNCQKSWESVIVIPASSLCWNFGNFDELPIAPWPRDKPTRDPFEYCRKKDHYRCFRVYVDSSFWYPHSVEELVIWTVEREKKCTFRQFMQRAIQLPSPTVSPRQTPPPSTSTGVPIPPSNSSPKQQPQSPTASNSSTSYATISMSPSKKKGPPSPLSLGGSGQSPPPPSFSSVAAGHSPKPSSPLLKQVSKGQGTAGTMASTTTVVSPSSTKPYLCSNADAITFVSDGNVNVGQSIHRPGKLADITGPDESYESVVFPFISNHKEIQHGVNSTTVSQLYQPEPLTGTSTINSVVSPTCVGLKNVKGGGGSGINTLAGSNSPMVASVSSRRNYRVASTSADVLATPPGAFGLVNGGNVVVASPTSLSSSHVLDTTLKPETVALKAMYKFSEVNFKMFSDIPHSLLMEIALCFKDKKLVCRRCFYGDRSISHLVQPMNKCSSGEHLWSNPIVVIPGCSLCDNQPLFKLGEHVAVPPLPPVAIIKKCEKLNHHKCFAQSLEADQRFAHSVEELVVWMVESENECSFEQFASSNGLLQLQAHPSTDTAKTSKDIPQESFNHQTVPQATFVPQQQNIPKPPATVTLATTTAAGASRSMEHAPPANGGSSSFTTDVMGKELYDPKKTEFVSIKDIPTNLLIAVAECFHNRLFVCRICFFESNCSKLVSKIETKQAIMCELGHVPWKQIKVVPRCNLCITPGDHAPIPPLPKHMKNSTIPFAVCKKTEHKTCYAMSRGTNPWFPHTVEELVIWTVERDRGIEFEQCYKEYLPGYAKSHSNLDAVSPLQTFYHPVNAFQSPTTTATEPHLLNPSARVLQGATQVLSNPQLQNGFRNALDLANLPQSRVANVSHSFDSSLTQPEPFQSGNLFPGEFRYNSSTQFDFPILSHPTIHPPANTTTGGGGLAPQISELLPPTGNNIPSASVDVPSAIPTADNTFTKFFPALLSENPLIGGKPQEVVSSKDGEKSVTDLFNLTAGLDLPTDFENPLGGLGSSADQKGVGIGTMVVNKDNDIESSWNEHTNKILTSEHAGNCENSSIQVDEREPLLVHGSNDANKMGISEESVNHALDRMDSFGFSTSASSTTDNAAAAVTGNPNWPDFVRIPNFYSQSPFGTDQVSVDTSSSNNENNNGELDIPRMPNTEPFVLGKNAEVGSEQNTSGNKVKLSPKGKKKKRKSNKKSSSSETTAQGGKGEVDNSNSSTQLQELVDVSGSEDFTSEIGVNFTEESVYVEEKERLRRVNYDLSSASTPTLHVFSSVPGFRSEGHTPPPPTTDDVNADVPSSTVTTLEPFADVALNGPGEDGIMQFATDTSGIGNLQISANQNVDDIFDRQYHELSTFSAMDTKLEGRSSILLGSIMAARASKGQESDVSIPVDDVSAFKLATQRPVFERIKDIEDESSQGSKEEEEVPQEPSVSVAPVESANEAEQPVDMEYPVVPMEEEISIAETIENAVDQNSLVQPEVVLPTITDTVESAGLSEPEDVVVRKEEAFLETDVASFAVEHKPVSEREDPGCPALLAKEALLKHAPVPEMETTVHTSNPIGGGVENESVAPSSEQMVPSGTAPEILRESSVDPAPQLTSEGISKQLAEWDLSQSSDEFDVNFEGEDQTLQHVPIEDWGCTLSDDDI